MFCRFGAPGQGGLVKENLASLSVRKTRRNSILESRNEPESAK